MKNFKRVLAFLCSATLIVGSSVTAFATTPYTDPTTSTAGAGNIIAYSVETVMVPTAIKVSFNPQKWAFKPDPEKTDTVTSQIVSLNYGIASMASMDRKVKISFAATGTTGTGETIEFVDSAEAATSKYLESGAGTADYGEYKMYLAVAASTAKVAGSGTTTFSVTNGAHNMTADLLGDVTMTAAEKGLAVFSAGSENVADADIAYKLGKATYTLKANNNPSFNTTQSGFAEMVEATGLGDIVGFTFTGAMNEAADWTKANLSAITIKPTYEFDEVDGTEEALGANGGYNQIGTEAAASALALTKQTNGNLTYQFEAGSYPTGTFSAVTVNGTAKNGQIGTNITYNATAGRFVVTSTAVTNLSLTQGNTTIVATIGSTDYTFTY